MKKSIATSSLLLMIPLFVTACVRETPERQAALRREAQAAVEKEAVRTEEVEPEDILAVGTVLETMDVEKYTYVQVDTGSEKIWAAAPKCQVNVGDTLVIPAGDPMQNFHSETLGRDFDWIYFVSSFHGAAGDASRGAGEGTGSAMPAGHPPLTAHPPMTGIAAPPEIDLSGLEKPEGGLTVAEIYTGKADLADKQVTLRGKVVKYNEKIMGKNWLHVQDGSGDATDGTNDLTVTTDATAKLGDTVLVTGTLHLDKDFGFGYQYSVIIEDAQVVTE